MGPIPELTMKDKSYDPISRRALQHRRALEREGTCNYLWMRDYSDREHIHRCQHKCACGTTRKVPTTDSSVL